MSCRLLSPFLFQFMSKQTHWDVKFKEARVVEVLNSEPNSFPAVAAWASDRLDWLLLLLPMMTISWQTNKVWPAVQPVYIGNVLILCLPRLSPVSIDSDLVSVTACVLPIFLPLPNSSVPPLLNPFSKETTK